jgi:hypothetical protein
VGRPAKFKGARWDGVTLRSGYVAEIVLVRDQLADDAKAGRWPDMLELLAEQHWWVNSSRLGGNSGYAPLHQVAWHGAKSFVVERLLALGAWRTLRTHKGLRAVDIAERRGHQHLMEILRPVPVHPVSEEVLNGLEQQLHLLISGRVPGLVTEHRLRLPQRGPITELDPAQMHFPVPKMHGSFNIELRGEELTVHSFNRVRGGWAQTHLITANSIKLLESEPDLPRHHA